METDRPRVPWNDIIGLAQTDRLSVHQKLLITKFHIIGGGDILTQQGLIMSQDKTKMGRLELRNIFTKMKLL